MKCRAVVPVLMFLLTATALVQAQEIVNLFDNPGFEEGTGTDVQEIPGWRLYIQENASGLLSVDTENAREGKQCLRIQVTAVPAGGAWNLRFEHTRRFAVKQSETYTMAFWLRGDPGPITLSPSRAEQNAAGQWGNLAQVVVRPTPEWQEYHLTFTSPEDRLVMWQLLISNPGQTYYVDHARCYVGQYVPDRIGPKLLADSPHPPDRATDVPRDVVLSWMAGEYPTTHDIYFGTVAADVGSATRTDPKGVLAGRGQADTTFDPPGVLEYGQTYYWRIDEVNQSPDGTVYQGDVWSFTVEPYGYPIKPVKATASSAQANMGPEKTIDGSGLTRDQHGTESTTMWLSAGVQPNWIQYEFDNVYRLYEMKVWNSNQMIETFLGFGAKTVTIETSADGATWTALADVPQFAQATGLPTYTANTTVNFAGIEAKFVKLTINANWGTVAPQTGLSEVQFSYIPVHARAPQPANAATGVSLDTALDWRPGREATAHKVFLGTDQAAVAAGTAVAKTVPEHGFDAGELSFGTTYYWKVDEVGDKATYPGEVWSFTTQEYAVVEDFEGYTDDEGSRIYETWIDGWENKTGSVVGYMQAPFAERTILHGGKQSMPLEYNNVKTPFYSETERTFSPTQDWTGNGADTLSLWFQGRPVAFLDKGDGAFTVGAGGHDIWDNADDFRLIYKRLSGNGSVTVRVDSLVNTNAWAKAGVMIRESLDAGSPMAYMIQSFSQGVSFGWRLMQGGTCNSTNQAGINAPQWVRLTRTGNAFTAQYSANGTTWTDIKNADGTVTTTTINMVGTVYIGLCVTSHNTGAATTAQFSGTATTGGVTGAWQQVWIGDDPDRTNSAAGLYLAIEDSTGKSAVVVHPDPAAAALGTWTQWKIPYSSLTGVNLARVKMMKIGVGDRANPKPGGAGLLYLDDIAFGHPAQ